MFPDGCSLSPHPSSSEYYSGTTVHFWISKISSFRPRTSSSSWSCEVIRWPDCYSDSSGANLFLIDRFCTSPAPDTYGSVSVRKICKWSSRPSLNHEFVALQSWHSRVWCLPLWHRRVHIFLWQSDSVREQTGKYSNSIRFFLKLWCCMLWRWVMSIYDICIRLPTAWSYAAHFCLVRTEPRPISVLHRQSRACIRQYKPITSPAYLLPSTIILNSMHIFHFSGVSEKSSSLIVILPKRSLYLASRTRYCLVCILLSDAKAIFFYF